MGLRLRLHGSVQGVGFRPWVSRLARDLDLRGSVANAVDGVWIDAFGTDESLDRLRRELAAPALVGARVESIDVTPLPDTEAPCVFTIEESRSAGRLDRGERQVDVAPDLPVCDACLAEIDDPASRRAGYAFTSCVHCGPRYTLVRELPWQRARTTMAAFALCDACRAEFDTPSDRRHHAEATACPACGPTLSLAVPGSDHVLEGDAALDAALDVLRAGGHVAVLGVGGFHLACDARDERAVRRLRARKQRARKPFAVMVRTLAEVEKLAWVDDAERALLRSEARPIVLMRRREDAGLAPSLAPGLPMLGAMLAYTPLHAMLLRRFGGQLVMTSANRSGEPIPYRAEQAEADLADLCDAILAHDRAVEAPCDDSVVSSSECGPIWLRRSRGHVPRPIRLAHPVRQSVLALGGQWNDTICVGKGGHVWPSAHIGDLESPASVDRLDETTRRWLRWLDIEPEIVAHDLHPAYESTRMATAWRGARVIGVQHHHAHMAAVLGEHGVEGPALGLVWDGTGAGLDGSAWGGELFCGDAAAVRRVATFRPIALAGGEQAIREPWRLALALLDDAFDGRPPVDALALFDTVPRDRRQAVEAMLSRDGLCARAHGVGRYFDAIGALVLCTPRVSHQGELAQALCFAADRRPAPPYAFEIDRSGPVWQIDLRAAVRALADDVASGVAPGEVADRFHATLVAAGALALESALPLLREAQADGAGSRPRAVLAGGCFQSPLLVEGFEQHLARTFDVLRASALPPGDGGLAFGQVIVADAIARRQED